MAQGPWDSALLKELSATIVTRRSAASASGAESAITRAEFSPRNSRKPLGSR